MKKKKRDFKKAQDIRVSWNNYDELFTFSFGTPLTSFDQLQEFMQHRTRFPVS